MTRGVKRETRKGIQLTFSLLCECFFLFVASQKEKSFKQRKLIVCKERFFEGSLQIKIKKKRQKSNGFCFV